ncbi:hypothetical protein DFQ26_008641 [Actinomortierella ambigua]|nr:hypothetical protein DFQ26_008641 [Actinomortierella ambigua]
MIAQQLPSLVHRSAQENALGIRQEDGSDGQFSRNRLRDSYENLLLTDIVQAQGKDIDGALWKQVFYASIDSYRKKIADWSRLDNNVLPQSQPAGRGGRGGKHQQQRRNQQVPPKELRVLKTKFRAFLQEAQGFYLHLISQLAERYHLAEVDHLLQKVAFADTTVNIPEDARRCAILSCHKCYIFLGDLARYSETYSDKMPKRWDVAESYYNIARKLAPQYGNPYNQLAVIETFAPDNFLSLYYYFRSLVVEYPFMTARNNIKVLVKRLGAEPTVELQQPKGKSRQGDKDRSVLLLNLLSRLVSYHGALFLRTSPEAGDLDWMTETLEKLCRERDISVAMLLKVQMVNMSSLYIMTKYSDADEEDRNKWDTEALDLILEFFITLLRFASQEIQQHQQAKGAAQSRMSDVLPSPVHRSMATIRLSMKWLAVNLAEVKRLDSTEESMSLRATLSKLWEEMVTFLSALLPIFPYHSQVEFSRNALKEDANELQGFAALNRAIDDRPLSSVEPAKISAFKEMQIRVADLYQDALQICKDPWTGAYARLIDAQSEHTRLMFSNDPATSVFSMAPLAAANPDGGYPIPSSADAGYHVGSTPGSYQSPEAHVGEEEAENADDSLDMDAEQRHAVDALVSDDIDDDNDVSLILDDDDDEIVLFRGRQTSFGNRPTPPSRPPHLKTGSTMTTGVIGSHRRGSHSPTHSIHSSPNCGPAGGGGGGGTSLGGTGGSTSPLFYDNCNSSPLQQVDEWRQSISSGLKPSSSVSSSSSSSSQVALEGTAGQGGGGWNGVRPMKALGNGTLSPTLFDLSGASGFYSPLAAGSSSEPNDRVPGEAGSLWRQRNPFQMPPQHPSQRQLQQQQQQQQQPVSSQHPSLQQQQQQQYRYFQDQPSNSRPWQ